VASEDLLQDAINELYSVAPAQFIERRAALAGAAKQAGDQAPRRPSVNCGDRPRARGRSTASSGPIRP
jgi:hypothetical protein